MPNTTFVLIALILICTRLYSFAQTRPGDPLSYKHGVGQIPFEIGTYELNGVIDIPSEKQRIQELRDSLNLSGLQNGFGIEISINVKAHGAVNILDDGSKLYLLKIGLPEALGMRIIFGHFKIPTGSRVFFYNLQKTSKWGAYTDMSNHPSGSFATPEINGDTVIIEYFEPKDREFDGILEINTLVYIFA